MKKTLIALVAVASIALLSGCATAPQDNNSSQSKTLEVYKTELNNVLKISEAKAKSEGFQRTELTKDYEEKSFYDSNIEKKEVLVKRNKEEAKLYHFQDGQLIKYMTSNLDSILNDFNSEDYSDVVVTDITFDKGEYLMKYKDSTGSYTFKISVKWGAITAISFASTKINITYGVTPEISKQIKNAKKFTEWGLIS